MTRQGPGPRATASRQQVPRQQRTPPLLTGSSSPGLAQAKGLQFTLSPCQSNYFGTENSAGLPRQTQAQATTAIGATGEIWSGSGKSTAAANKPNTAINDNLNAADQMFKAGMDGCPSVSIALTAANSPAIYGAPTAEQKASLKAYAARCNLRY